MVITSALRPVRLDHVQLPLLIDYPDDWPENTTLQTLMNGWANEGLGPRTIPHGRQANPGHPHYQEHHH